MKTSLSKLACKVHHGNLIPATRSESDLAVFSPVFKIWCQIFSVWSESRSQNCSWKGLKLFSRMNVVTSSWRKEVEGSISLNGVKRIVMGFFFHHTDQGNINTERTVVIKTLPLLQKCLYDPWVILLKDPLTSRPLELARFTGSKTSLVSNEAKF